MPYVTKEFIEFVDSEIALLLEKLNKIKQNHTEGALDGEVNYTMTRILDNLYGGGGYYVFNRAMGILDCVAREFYRRKVVPYEDEKCGINGDVYRYKT